MTSDDILALAGRFFAAIETGNAEAVRQCYAPDVRIWNNGMPGIASREENLEILRGFIARSVSREYRNRQVDLLPDGFVQQHLLVAVADDGHVLELPACVICRVADGCIEKLEEYFDWSGMPDWFARTQARFDAAGLAASRPQSGETR